ncbi:hypothetical protein CAOG_009895 [Capsaspora owczarzaki ATCC 30864]|uniref:Uncharacterized protein n=1 Tax=Capsaspora owczarzaki (strain ATCC 30864) TaxID=595528 RepID=A0A0D2VV03_CAPO3|nr:hypothetical protein CAOG_009895 [Capsaspora owczarzaki ATCC 30864]
MRFFPRVTPTLQNQSSTTTTTTFSIPKLIVSHCVWLTTIRLQESGRKERDLPQHQRSNPRTNQRFGVSAPIAGFPGSACCPACCSLLPLRRSFSCLIEAIERFPKWGRGQESTVCIFCGSLCGSVLCRAQPHFVFVCSCFSFVIPSIIACYQRRDQMDSLSFER